MINELMLVEDKLHQILGSSEGLIKEMCINLLNAGGKRLRPMLTLQSGMCFAPLNNAMISAAVAGELIHMASLVHDDIIDESIIRRGQSTINHDLGNHIAVLSGDYIFAQAFSLLSSQNLLVPMQYMCEAIQSMCQGEINQAREQFNPHVSLQQYFRRVEEKTASLLVASCKSGAYCAGANSTELKAIEEYGIQIGYAFQIVDDLTDYIGVQNKAGKPLGKDLSQGHITLPLILLLHDSSANRWMKNLLHKKEISAEEISITQNLLIKGGYISKCGQIAAQCIYKAKNSLQVLRDSSAKKILSDLADQILAQTALSEHIV